ncbi:reverse transcriptase domain-containing protein [Tanacetum coccineum]
MNRKPTTLERCTLTMGCTRSPEVDFTFETNGLLLFFNGLIDVSSPYGYNSHTPRMSFLFPLFKTLKKCTKKGYFRRTAEAKEAFAQLKENLATLPTYLFAAHGVVSAVLLTDRDSVQTPVYFISKALQQTELNYSPMEKMILALVCVAKRMRRYFQAHPIAMITDQPIKQVISKPDVVGRLQKWSVLL